MSKRPESDKELGLVDSATFDGVGETTGQTTKGADMKPSGPKKEKASASSARKAAADFGGDFRLC